MDSNLTGWEGVLDTLSVQGTWMLEESDFLISCSGALSDLVVPTLLKTLTGGYSNQDPVRPHHSSSVQQRSVSKKEVLPRQEK